MSMYVYGLKIRLNWNCNKSFIVILDCWMISVSREKIKFPSSALIADQVGPFPLFLKYYPIPQATVELTNLIPSRPTYFFYFFYTYRPNAKNL